MPTNIIESSQEFSDKDFFCVIIILLQSLVIYNYNLVTSTWMCSIRILSSVGGYYPAPLALLFRDLIWRQQLEDWRRFHWVFPTLAGLQWWPVDHDWSLSTSSITWLSPGPTSPEYSPVFITIWSRFLNPILKWKNRGWSHHGLTDFISSHLVPRSFLDCDWSRRGIKT